MNKSFKFYLFFILFLAGFRLSGIAIPSPVFNHGHGFYESPFYLQISCADPEALIYYTTDGSLPKATKGIKYTTPINIQTTTVLRAVAIKPGQFPSKVTTCTYLFPYDIIHQANPPGYPLQWGPYTGIAGSAKADYEMDPEMTSDPGTAAALINALKSLPTISLVTDKGYFFSPSQNADTGGIYIYTGPPLTDSTNGLGFGWERPVSFEYFDAKDSVSFQVDCGVELHGGHSRRAEKSPKHSLRLVFKSIYGPSRLQYPLFGEDAVSDFNAIILRAGFNNTWVHHSSNERVPAQYINDAWAKDTQRAMGYKSSYGIFVHLYINGLYWGIYNPSEKLDKDYAESYLGGNADDYDVIKDYTEVVNGNLIAWNKLQAMANAGVTENDDYQRIIGNNPDGTPNSYLEPMVDAISLADYMILNFYAGNSDWDHHNWVAIRNRVNPGTGFRFFCWDEEKILENINTNIVNENNIDCPSRVFQQLMQNIEFRRLFADRVQKFCFDGGILSPGPAAERYRKRALQIQDALIAESARWGDYRRDVHRWQAAGPFDLYTPEAYWLPRLNYLLGTYFPGRTDIFISQLKSAGLIPSVDAPVFRINGNQPVESFIDRDDVLSMSSAEGTIYYTIDGRDPIIFKNPSTVISPSSIKYSAALTLRNSVHVKARTFSNGIWSALNDRFFIVPDDYNNIKITEINYNPVNQDYINNDDIEFIELKNTGNSSLNLEGLKFIEGIKYKFPCETQFDPGEFVVLVSDSAIFNNYYHFHPYGQYEGKLNNDGERIVMVNSSMDTIISIHYRKSPAWPTTPDGYGNTLVSKDINPNGLQDDPEKWRASYYFGGSPGTDDIFNPEDLQVMVFYDLVTMYTHYPNPFSDYVYIPYKLSVSAAVELSVFNMSGDKIVTIENQLKEAGDYVTAWKGTDQNGNHVANGFYFFRMVVKGRNKADIITRKVVIAR